jgi:hypothetical protein
MFYQKVKSVCFSPTGNSKKVADAIAKSLQTSFEYVDLTNKKASPIKGDILYIPALGETCQLCWFKYSNEDEKKGPSSISVKDRKCARDNLYSN